MSAAALEGEVTVESTGQNYPMLIGNLVAICFSGIVCIAVSLMDPDDYDWESTRNIRMVETYDNAWFNDVDYNEATLTAAKNWIMKFGLGFTLVIVIIWPVLSLPAGVFSEGYFDFWVILSIIWGIVATVFVVFLPLWESREGMGSVFAGIFGGSATSSTAKTAEKAPEVAEQ